jgi:flagellar protein FlbD
VIVLNRLNGRAFALNPDLIERAECTPDTVITLVDGAKYLVGESLEELADLVRHYRAQVLADAQALVSTPPRRPARDGHELSVVRDEEHDGSVVPLHGREH